MANISKITLPDGNQYDIKDTVARAAIPSAASSTPLSPSSTGAVGTSTAYAREDHVHPVAGMYIASYGSSTYADVLAAYQANLMVYCRASSNSNPGTGDQLRMAFLAYVNNKTTPTEFEFQYYRSVASHSDSQQGDQVFVYKLNSSGTWSVTTREAYTKIVAGTGLSSSYSNGALTLSSTGGGGSAVTYALSISSNVITLTGSDSSTSSVTLPVYDGSVSSGATGATGGTS